MGVPHLGQYSSSVRRLAPHELHATAATRTPHLRQNMSSSATIVPHEGHVRPPGVVDASGSEAAMDTSTCSPAAARFDCRAIESAAASSFASNRVLADPKRVL